MPAVSRPGPPSWEPPSQVDEYQVLRPLGAGGMGTVHVARDSLLDRLVAIKFISGDIDELARQRFQNEGRALARLTHPNVVSVYRVGESGDRPYLVCELVEGATLNKLALPLPLARVITIGMSAARGLAAVHRHGVLHRDLKPANIAVMANGEAKLLDFGLATLEESRVPGGGSNSDEWALTNADRIVGTRVYLAPELLARAPASRSTDIYGLGAVLYEIASGSLPMQGDPDPAPPCQDVAVSAIINRCLAEDPDRRFPTAEDLCHALEELAPGMRMAPVPEGNPYRGLRSYEAEHRSLFYGRSAETAAVIDRLRGEPIVAVAGDSGVGKSSLCRAGVLPPIAVGELDPACAWTVISVRPGHKPVRALAAALSSALGLGEDSAEDLLRSDPAAVGRWLRRRLGSHRRLLLFVDQAEELVTVAPPAEAALIGEALASFGHGNLRALLTVRGDLFTRLAALPGLADWLPGGLYVLKPLTSEQARQAVVGPAQRVGCRFESDALVDKLVAAAVGAPGGLALLSFALAELWERRDPTLAVLSSAALEAIGRVSGALARHADGLLASLSPEQREAVPRILIRLVTPDGARQPRAAGELVASSDGRAALDSLVSGRLLVVRQASGQTAYELAHEALIEGWAALRGWLESSVAARAARQRLGRAAAEWARLAEDRTLLWTPRQLLDVERLDPEDLGATELAFVAASRGALRRRRTARGLILAGAAILVGGVYGGARWQARAALARTVATHREPAQHALVQARAASITADTLRRAARAGYLGLGRGPRSPDDTLAAAETAHLAARALEKRAEADLLGASHTLEAALLLDPHGAGLRDLLAQVTALRLDLAERAFDSGRAAEMRLRLETFAAGSPLLAALRAPARLDLTTSPPGAHVAVERYDDHDGLLVAVPAGDLGATPVTGHLLPQGSYRLTLTAPGRAPVRLPILAGRGERLALAAWLPAERDVPAGTVYIPAGRSLFGSADDEGLRRFQGAPPQLQVSTGAYLIGRHEVTFAEYIAYLRELPPAERAARLPRAESAIRGSLLLEQLPPDRWRLTLQPAGVRAVALDGEPIRFPGRDRRVAQDWLHFPVAAVSWNDARAYLAWLDRTGRLPGARLCTEHEWERAARGADDRIYPHGRRLAPDDANHDATYGRQPDAYGPDEVGAHPITRSPYGVEDMVGNVWEWTESVQRPGEPSVRGGSYYQEEFSDRATNRDVGEADARDPLVGFRVCAAPPSHLR